MSYKLKSVFKTSGILLIISGLFMLFPLVCSVYYHEFLCAGAFLISGALSLLLGLGMRVLASSHHDTFDSRRGYLTVIFAFIVCSLVGALPYMISGEIPSFPDAFFESVAGYTTTGASTVSDMELSNSLIMWKAVTHWLGGIGALFFVIFVLPVLGFGSQRIATAEIPEPGLVGIAPRVQDIVILLGIAYVGLTTLEFFLLLVGSDMGSFEALINSMSSISTAGIMLNPGGISYYNSLYVELVITIFSILAGANFMVYIYLMKGSLHQITHNIEIRTYLMIIIIASIIVTLSLRISGTCDSIGQALRYGFFQVSSFVTTSGFVAYDYSAWPNICSSIFLILMFIGGCAASTSGSIKSIRILIMMKLIKRGFFLRIHPRSVKAIKVGDSVISAKMTSTVSAFIILYCFAFVVCSLILSLQGLDMETTISATASLMSSTGIAFGEIGSGRYFGMFCDPLKIFMSFIMMLGRLELFTVFIMFTPYFWRLHRYREE